MADYQLTATDIVVRTADQVYIPNDPGNRDRMEYEAWLAAGGVPDPYVAPPEPKPEATQAQQNEVLLDHENRLRAIAGDPPLTPQDFDKLMRQK